MTDYAGQTDVQLVTFLIDGEEYGVDVMQVKEIICLPQITAARNAQPHVEGMINLRGSVLPVVSLRKRLGLPRAEYDLDTRIAVINLGGDQVGLIIDGVAEVMRVKSSDIRPAAELIGQSWIAGILNLEKLVVVLDLEKLGVL